MTRCRTKQQFLFVWCYNQTTVARGADGGIMLGMRILHVANFSWFAGKRKRAGALGRYYAMDRKITNGLIRNGHSVWDFSYRDIARHILRVQIGKRRGVRAMNDYLLALATKIVPDVILLGHCELVTPYTLQRFREQLPHCAIGQWWVDPFTSSDRLKLLQAKQPYLDAFFATSSPDYFTPLLRAESTPPPLLSSEHCGCQC